MYKKSMDDIENKGLSELIQVKPPVSFVKLTGNGGFCNNFLSKSSMTVLPTESTEENYRADSLIYSVSQNDDISAEAFATIIDLLNQLKAATSDQNVFVQNNTVVREQILRQLKSEILKSHNSLTNNQIKNLEVVSSNNFDEQTLTDILKSLLESSKKKSDEKEPLVYRAEKASKPAKSNSERIAEDYLKILKNVHHYSKIVEDVFNHVSSKKTIHKVADKAEQAESERKEAAQKPQTGTKKIHHIANEITGVLSADVIQEIQETFENKIIKKLGLIAPIVKLQSKISELNVVSNVNKLVTEVVRRSVPRVLKSNTKLINKIVDRSEIEELKENILSHEEQYQVDKAVHKRNLDRIYNDIRKVYSTKNLSQNIFEVLKSSKFKNVNFEEAIKKNLLKVTSKNEVVNKLKNIYEKQVQKNNVKRVVDKSELVNRETTEVLDTEERSAIEDIVNLKRSNRNIETRFSEQQNIVDRIFKNINSRNVNYKTLIKNLEIIPNKTLEQKEILKRVFISHFLEGKDRELFRDTKTIDKFIEKHKDLIVSDRIYDRIENEYEFKPIHLREKVINNQEIEEVVEKNVKKILTPQVLTDSVTMITAKDIYRNVITPKVTKHIKTIREIQNEYLIHSNRGESVERTFDYVDTPYMVYKEEPRGFEQKPIEKVTKHIPGGRERIDEEPHIKEIVRPETIDTHKLERDIIKKTLSKKDVENMISERMQGVNVDSISRAVMGRVEAKMKMDRRRNGIF